eukprot:scaffold32037_cov20-Tisochrysis_lutea.AAC.1
MALNFHVTDDRTLVTRDNVKSTTYLVIAQERAQKAGGFLGKRRPTIKKTAVRPRGWYVPEGIVTASSAAVLFFSMRQQTLEISVV